MANKENSENLDTLKEGGRGSADDVGEKEKNPASAVASSNPDANTLSSLKQKSKYVRKAYTQSANLLRSQMENGIKLTTTDLTYAKMTALTDELANNTSVLLTLPEEIVPPSTLSELLKQAKTYDNNYTEISNQYITYGNTMQSQNKKRVSFTSTRGSIPESIGSYYQIPDSDDYNDDEAVTSGSGPIVKFQPLKLPRFGGDVNNMTEIISFVDWMSLFELSISRIPSKAMKQAYLLQSLDKPAIDSVRNIPCSEVGYEATIKILAQSFGNMRRNIQLSIKNLLSTSLNHLLKDLLHPSPIEKIGLNCFGCIVRYKTQIREKYHQKRS